MGAVAVERRAAADDEELFRLYQDVFGAELTENSRKRWIWQYRENPATPQDGPEIWVARDGDVLLGQYALFYDDPNLINTYTDRINKITAADLQRVAKQYLVETNRTVVITNPKSTAPSEGGR